MLQITIPEREFWDEEKEEFVYIKEHKLRLEHSLVSISKWETKWHKAWFGKREKTNEEIYDYVRCMTLDQNVKPEVYKALTRQNFDEIMEYLKDSMTSIKFPDTPAKSKSKDTVTSELIRFWMVSYNAPIEYEKWHINKLMAFLRVCSMKSGNDNKKVNKAALRSRNAAINERNKALLHTKG